MQVEVTFPDVPPGTLEVMMSRTSPGRYAIHEFARNVYDVQIDDGAGGAAGRRASESVAVECRRRIAARFACATRCSAITSMERISRSTPRTRT